MKKFLRVPLSLLLTLALLLAATGTAAASEALGEDLTAQDTAIHQSTTLSQDVFWSTTYSDLRTENVVTYQPNASVTPIVTYGSTLTSCNTLSSMLYRYLGLDAAKYADVTLPFADSAKISDYAVPAIRALYSAGIINGSAGSDGKLYFSPASNLTRAQAAAMIGRTQAKGYATAALSFTDASSIPSYATYYIQSMVSL